MSMQPAIFQSSRSKQSGAGALIVVMVLFFIVSLTAAYTSRNLIFEQRTSANQFRATNAFEVAEAGLEWAAAQLNAGRIDNSCIPTVDTTASYRSFRQRYLDIDAGRGDVTPATESGTGSVQPSCVFDGGAGDLSASAWMCRCPLRNAGTPPLDAPSSSTGPAPAFLLTMQPINDASYAERTDLIEVVSSSCTRLDATCLSSPDQVVTGDAVAQVRAIFALRGSITRLPAAALSLHGTLLPLAGGAQLNLSNANTAANGLTLHTGVAPSSLVGVNRSGLPGARQQDTVVLGDGSLQPAAIAAVGTQPAFSTEDRRFSHYFGMRPTTYMRQPGMVVVPCTGGCTAADINQAMLRNPGRSIWVKGAGAADVLSIDADIGGISTPALLIVEGPVAFSNGAVVTGLIHGRHPSWTWSVAGPAVSIVGAVTAEGDLQITGAGTSTSIRYDGNVLTTLRLAYGTFVRVQGSWRDFAS